MGRPLIIWNDIAIRRLLRHKSQYYIEVQSPSPILTEKKVIAAGT